MGVDRSTLKAQKGSKGELMRRGNALTTTGIRFQQLAGEFVFDHRLLDELLEQGKTYTVEQIFLDCLRLARVFSTTSAVTQLNQVGYVLLLLQLVFDSILIVEALTRWALLRGATPSLLKKCTVVWSDISFIFLLCAFFFLSCTAS